MEINCEHCEATLTVSDEAIPKDQVVRIRCPKCKNKMTFDTGRFDLSFTESKRGGESESDSYRYGDFSEDEALSFYEEGTKLALVMDTNPERSKEVRAVVEQLGYHCVSAPNTRDALGRMRFHHFDLVILFDGFDGQGLENSPILNYFNHISISDRRRIFLTLIGQGFKTMDNMMTFALSANAVLNTKDLDKLSAILKRAILDNEKFYKVFMDTLIEVGKA